MIKFFDYLKFMFLDLRLLIFSTTVSEWNGGQWNHASNSVNQSHCIVLMNVIYHIMPSNIPFKGYITSIVTLLTPLYHPSLTPPNPLGDTLVKLLMHSSDDVTCVALEALHAIFKSGNLEQKKVSFSLLDWFSLRL